MKRYEEMASALGDGWELLPESSVARIVFDGIGRMEAQALTSTYTVKVWADGYDEPAVDSRMVALSDAVTMTETIRAMWSLK